MMNPFGANHERHGIPDRAVWVRAPTGVIVCVLEHFALTLPLSTHVLKSVLSELILRGTVITRV